MKQGPVCKILLKSVIIVNICDSEFHAKLISCITDQALTAND